MAIKSSADLLTSLLLATTPSAVTTILETLGDTPDTMVGEPIGTSKYQWQYYGGKDTNWSTIGYGSEPTRSLVERVTNGIDAIIERRMHQSPAPSSPPTSPMEAAERWFGRPPSTYDTGIFSWHNLQGADKKVHVVMLPGDNESRPTIDVVDNGIGIRPEDFPSTILSLQQGNKITRSYVIGIYGQGGSATIGFSQYVLVLSRCVDEPKTVGFTVVKLLNLREPYKTDAYVYLVSTDDNGNVELPTFDTDSPIELYPQMVDTIEDNVRPPTFESGTVVRHYGYDLTGLTHTFSPAPGNLWHHTNYMLFDPVLPFRLVDMRNETNARDEIISGSRNRLMNLKSSDFTSWLNDPKAGNVILRHYFPREMVSPRGDEGASIGIEYWVVLARRKSGDKYQLRSFSNDLFVDRTHPIIGTMNGQNHGQLSGKIIRDLKLTYLSRHIIVHIDATAASSQTRRDLFTTTRENFKQGGVIRELTRLLSKMLEEDEVLFEIEKELTTQIVHKGETEINQEVARQIRALLKDAGYQVSQTGEGLVPGGSGPAIPVPTKGIPGRRQPQPKPPLKTLPYPDVTRFEIVYPKDYLFVRQLDSHVVRIETDANYRFDREGKLAIRFEPPYLEVASKSLLKDGRFHWRVRPTEAAKLGDMGVLTVTLTKPDGAQLTDECLFQVQAAETAGSKPGGQGLVPAFKVTAIDPETEQDRFDQVWTEYDEANIGNIAYKALDELGLIHVYYSTGFAPFKQEFDKLKASPDVAQLFVQNYEIWIGYHAILQLQQRKDMPTFEDVEEEHLDQIEEHERAVVANMQVKQASQMAQLQTKALLSSVSE